MTNLDFNNKEYVTSYSYTTANYDRTTTRTVRYLGRVYTAYGVNQVVTAIGQVYAVKQKDSDKRVNVLFVGISRQSPYERNVDKALGEETAAMYAQTSPQIVMVLPEYFSNRAFYHMMNDYVYNMRLEMMKTAGEIREKNKKSNKVENITNKMNDLEMSLDNVIIHLKNTLSKINEKNNSIK